MTPRTFDAYQALARQPMRPRDLRAALGCTTAQAYRAAQSLCETGQARRRIRPGIRGYVYEVVR
jgi:predicted transcriptional regulator